MSLRKTVECTHMTRRLAPEFLDTIDMSLVVCEELGMVDPEMMKV